MNERTPTTHELRPVVNAAISDASLDELGASVEASKTGHLPPGVSVQMTAAGATPTSWIQLARTGTWSGHGAGEFTFDADTYAEIVKNFARTLNREVPLDFEHAAESINGGVFQKGAPAQGWIKELRYNDDMLEGRVEWVPEQPGMTYVRQKAYKYISPAVIFKSIDRVTGKPIGAELTSAALTNRPFLDGMRVVTARHKDNAMTAADETQTATEAAQPTGTQLTVTADAKDGDSKGKKKKKPEKMDDDPGGEGGDAEGDIEMKKKASIAESAKASDRRTKPTQLSLSFNDTIRSLCEELCDEVGYSACIVDVYDAEVIYRFEGRLWSRPYKADGSKVSLDGEPREVERSYSPISAMEAKMNSKVNGILGLVEGAAEPLVLSAVQGLKDTEALALDASGEKDGKTAVTKLRASHETLVATCKALGFADLASPADIAKKVTELTARAEKASQIEPKLAAAETKLAERDAKDAEAEIDFIIKCGRHYGVEMPEAARASLKLHRANDPAGFAETYKAPLDGLKSRDNVALFNRVAAPGGQLGTTPAAAAPVPAMGGDASNKEFEAEVDKFIEEQKKNGRQLTRNEARGEVHKLAMQKVLAA